MGKGESKCLLHYYYLKLHCFGRACALSDVSFSIHFNIITSQLLLLLPLKTVRVRSDLNYNSSNSNGSSSEVRIYKQQQQQQSVDHRHDRVDRC